MKFSYQINGGEHTLLLEKHAGGFRARVGEEVHEVKLVHAQDGQLHFQLGETLHTAQLAHETSAKRWLHTAGRTFIVEKSGGARRRGSDGAASNGRLTAPMPGQIRAVLVAAGDEVAAGQPLLLMEAMKMEIRIAAPYPGRVAALHVTEDITVNKDAVLIEIEAHPASTD